VGSNSTIISFEGNRIVLQHKPFRMDFYVGSKLVMTANGKGLLNVEPIKDRSPQQQQEGSEEDKTGIWVEEFSGFHDVKRNGASAVSLDFSFPNSKGLCGIPERATSLLLQPTK